jgi:iron uptake system EfeUOB component EfeO/EfeM
MSDIRFVNTTLKIAFDLVEKNPELFQKEFDRLAHSDEDPVGQWLKLAKARGETSESDQVLLTLLVELHRKVDELSAYIKDEKPEFIKLSTKAEIDAIGFEHFRLSENLLQSDKEYYGRISMPTFPKREMPLFFKALDTNIAQITLLHDQDEKDWNAYMVARERVMIRQRKARDEH